MNENEEAVIANDDEYDVDLSDLEDLMADEGEGNQTEPEEAEQETQAQESEQETQDEQESDTAKADEQTQDAGEMFDLKHNKETRQYTRQQVTELAQKGLDYERVTAQRDRFQQENAELARFRDENAELLQAIQAATSISGKGVPEFIRSIRVNALIAQGLNREVAQERILREDAERQLTAQRQAASNVQKVEQRQMEDIARFQKKYADVDPKSIPQEVWQAVGRGELLVDAYGDYKLREAQKQLKEANEKLATRSKNESNRQKTLGSMSSTAKATGKDLFLEGFLGED